LPCSRRTSARQLHQEKHKGRNRADLKVGVIYLPRTALRESPWATASGSGTVSVYQDQNNGPCLLRGKGQMETMRPWQRSTWPALHLPSCLLSSPLLPDMRNYLLLVVVTGDIMVTTKRSTSRVNCHLAAHQTGQAWGWVRGYACSPMLSPALHIRTAPRSPNRRYPKLRQVQQAQRPW